MAPNRDLRCILHASRVQVLVQNTSRIQHTNVEVNPVHFMIWGFNLDLPAYTHVVKYIGLVSLAVPTHVFQNASQLLVDLNHAPI